MPQKIIELPTIGTVVLQKNRLSRSLRLTVGHQGQVKLTMPTWTPYRVGQAFVLSKTEWLKRQLVTRPRTNFKVSDRIGKFHRLVVKKSKNDLPLVRVTADKIVVSLPISTVIEQTEVQNLIIPAAVRALKQEAKSLLPDRLKAHAQRHNFTFHSVNVKQLRSRWGSCTSARDITLNCYLMQLPWELIDYVLLHELVHTKVLAHGKPFWEELARVVPDLPAKRKAIRAHRPDLLTFI